MLRTVGKHLKGQLRSHRDVAARLGGESFAILCFGALDEDLLRLVADCIRTQIGDAGICDATLALRVTASIGLAISHADDLGWKTLYARADSGLHQAKLAGRDHVMFAAR